MDNRAKFLAGDAFILREGSKITYQYITIEDGNPESGGYIEKRDPYSGNPSEVVCNVNKIRHNCFDYFINVLFEAHSAQVYFSKLIFGKEAIHHERV